jgi:hypothetical protein
MLWLMEVSMDGHNGMLARRPVYSSAERKALRFEVTRKVLSRPPWIQPHLGYYLER